MAEANGSGAASGFTVKEILLEMRGDLRSLSEQINRIDRQGSIGTKQELEDHEIRIRTLETSSVILEGGITSREKLGVKIISLTALSIAASSAIIDILSKVH
jgi:hypothetical protein